MAAANANKTGVRMAPALNPEQMALTQPWKDYVSRGLITELSAVFTPMGTMITIKVAESLPIPEGMSREAMAPGAAKAAIEASGLIPKKGKGQGNKTKEDPLPKKSLCKKDFEGDSKHMQSRLTEVIKNLGGATIAGRIGSLNFSLKGLPISVIGGKELTPLTGSESFVTKRISTC